MRRNSGFTLIELMIVVAIIAILAAIAIPSYSDYVRRGRITEALAGLSAMRVKMEQYFQDNRKYTGSCVAGTLAPLPESTSSFTFGCTPAPDLTTYTVKATGHASMQGFEYSIDQNNVRTSVFAAATGWTGSASCWVLKKDGSC